MKNKINLLIKFLNNNNFKKYAKDLENIIEYSEVYDLEDVPIDVFAFTLAYLEICDDSLGYLKTLYEDLNEIENMAEDDEFSSEKEKDLEDIEKAREESTLARRKIIDDNPGKRTEKLLKEFDLRKKILRKDIFLVHDFMEKHNPNAKLWYDNFRKYMRDNIFDGNDDTLLAKTFYRILAATSVQKNPITNFDLTQSILEEVPKDFDVDEYYKGKTMIKDRVTKDKSNFLSKIRGLMPAHKTGIIAALKGFEIEGPKVSRFSMNLQGNFQEVTMDVHMFDFLFQTRDDYIMSKGRRTKINKTNISEGRRRVGEKLFQRSAQKISLEPAQLQAAIWMFRTEVEVGFFTSYDYMHHIEDRRISLRKQIKNLEQYLENIS